MGTGERERCVGEAPRQGLWTAALAGDIGQVGGVESDAVAGRHDRAIAVGRPGALHGALDTALELDRLQVGSEQPSGGALEDAFEEPFDVGKHGHRSRNRTRGGGNDRAAGPTRVGRGTSVRHPPWGNAYTLASSGRCRRLSPCIPGSS